MLRETGPRPSGNHPPLAGPRDFPVEALPHIALIFCILRAQSDWMQTFYAPNHRSFFKTSQFKLDAGFVVHCCVKPATNESKNAKQMRNTKQNCFSHSSASPRNDKQCSAKQCFANQTNRCLAGFASRSDLFRDNARLTKHRRKVNQRHLILQAMYTTM